MKLWFSLITIFGIIFPTLKSVGNSSFFPQISANDPFSYPGVTVRFEHLTIEDGLSQNSAFALFQDRQGYLWIGTQDGLNRYDGYGFTVFKNQPENPNSISQDKILELFQDSQGVIWIGTWGGGLNRFDPTTQSFIRYQNDPDDPTSLSHDLVDVILEDPSGNLWVGTMGGLDLLNRDNEEFTHYRIDPSDANTLSGNAISALYADQQGNLWVGTGAFGVRGYRLNRLDVASGVVERITLNCVAESAISKILQDEQGVLWLAHGGYNLPGSGLTRYDPATNECSNFRSNTNQPNSLSADNVTDLLLDENGALWVATNGGGIDRMDLQNPGIFQHYQNDPYDERSLNSDTVFSMMIDRTGILWIGTLDEGINKLNPATLPFRYYRHDLTNPQSISSSKIGSFAETADGQILVGTWGGGLNQFDPTTGQFKSYRHDPNDPFSLAGDVISALETQENGEVWIGYRGNGIDRFDLNTSSLTHYRRNLLVPTSLWNDEVMDLLHDGKDTLWVATMAGLDRMDTSNGQFTHYVPDSSKANSLSHPAVISLYLDPQNQLWVGTWGGGLNRLDLNNPDSNLPYLASFVQYKHDPNNPNSLDDDNVWAIYRSKSGVLWLGTQGGLNRFDPSTESFKVFREPNGLQGEIVYGIMEDETGFLWLTTNNGLARFDPLTETFIVYDSSNGLQSNEFNPNAYLRNSRGEMFVGGNQGFNLFLPAQIKTNLIPPPVVITRFSVLNQPYETDLSGETPIHLRYDQDFIAFDLAALDFQAPEKNQFAYQLEGFDPEYILAGTRPFASYTNLPGGEYLFRVKAANSDGIWNDAGLAIPIIVTPPFWETRSFQIIAVMVLFGTIIAGFQWRVRSLRERSQILETAVQTRTQDLRETNRLLKGEIEQRQKAEAALAQKAAEEAVISERTRLAHELHDAVTQTLFSASLIAEVLPELWQIDTVEAENSSQELRQLTRGALAEMRTLLLELRPDTLSQARLADLLQQLTEASIGRSRLPIQLTIEGERVLPPEVQLVFYRVAQESIHNIIKHARATRANIDLHLSPAGVHLSIRDNGIGFDPDKVRPTSLGLCIMCERASSIGADCQVTSQLGEGTSVNLIWYDDAVSPTKSLNE